MRNRDAWKRPSRMVQLSAFLSLLVGAGTASAQLLYTPDVTVEATGVTLTPRDVVTDPGSGALAPLTLPGLPDGVGLAAVHADANGDWLYVPAISVELPGPVFASRRDVVRDAGGTITIELDGGAAGIPLDAAIDALALTGAGELLLSFDTTVALPGLTVGDEDIARWNGGLWTLFFDGSSEGVSEDLDVDGAHYAPALDALSMSFDRSGSISGLAFDDEDVLGFDRSGATWSFEFDGSARDAALAAADLVAVPEPGIGWLVSAGVLSLYAARAVPTRRPQTGLD